MEAPNLLTTMGIMTMAAAPPKYIPEVAVATHRVRTRTGVHWASSVCMVGKMTPMAAPISMRDTNMGVMESEISVDIVMLRTVQVRKEAIRTLRPPSLVAA
mmetsp:Transcript_15406/g.18577  ORF Transcript_15406/g.18577 Transcript_15406/m.18577 type:complete len:101 (-) Transcript_15406:342-644(-)